MNRRDYLTSAGIASTTAIAGCSEFTALSEPDMEFMDSIVPDPRAVSVDTQEREYFGPIQNRGDDGDVRIELWFFENQNVPNPSQSSLYNKVERLDRYFDRSRSRYFNSGERREVRIQSSSSVPEWSEREFGIIPFPATYGAVFKNSGSTGDVEMRLEYKGIIEYDLDEPPTREMTVGADQEVEVMFDVVIPGGVEYEIIAEPL